MFDKYLVPLYMLYYMDGEIKGRTRFQKLVFLTKEKLKENNKKDVNLEFCRLFYGPFSRDLMESLNSLDKDGLVEEEVEEGSYGLAYIYKLTDNGRKFIKDPAQRKLLDSDTKKVIKLVAKDFGHTPLDDLISFVYARYPEYNPHNY